MPNPFLGPETLARVGVDGDALRITNPLVAEEDVLRPSLRPGLLGAVAFDESHRRPGVARFEIGHVYPPGPGELPDETRRSASCSPDRRRRLPSACGGRSPAPWVSARGSTRPASRPGCTRPDRRHGCGTRRHRPSARWPLTCWRRWRSTSASRVLELDLRPYSIRSPPGPLEADEPVPSSDLDLAFSLSEDVPAERLEKAIRRSRRTPRRRRAVRRLPWRHDRRRAMELWRTASASRRRTAT